MYLSVKSWVFPLDHQKYKISCRVVNFSDFYKTLVYELPMNYNL